MPSASVTVSSASDGIPHICRRVSYSVDHARGSGVNGLALDWPISRLSAACRADSTALIQCSTRRGVSSKRRFGQRAMSPAMTTSDAPSANSFASHSTPSLMSRPEPRIQSTDGTLPMASTTTLATSSWLFVRCSPTVSFVLIQCRTSLFIASFARCSWCASTIPLETRSPKRCSGAFAWPTRVTSRPMCRMLAANSLPIRPAPITTAGFLLALRQRRTAIESSTVRRIRTRGSCRGDPGRCRG